MPEVIGNWIHIPVKGEEGKHNKHKIRTVTVSEKLGIRFLYCLTCRKVISWLFDRKKGWTMQKAKRWLKRHNISYEE